MNDYNPDELQALRDESFNDDDYDARCNEADSLNDSDWVDTALKIKAERDELRIVLRDLALGAEMMLHPAMGISGAFKSFAAEVHRVATEALIRDGERT